MNSDQLPRQRGLLLVIVTFLNTIGCGSGIELSTLQATVQSNGQGVSQAQILFQNVEKKTPGNGFGITDETGRCVINYPEEGGLAPGKYKVEVSVETQEDGSPLPEGEEGAVLRNQNATVAQIYEFDLTLNPGDNIATLNLEDGVTK